MSAAAELERLLAAQPKPDCAKLTPFTVDEADFDAGRVKVRFAAQPAFKNHFGNVQGGFAVAMIDVLVSLAAYAKTRAWLPTVEIKSSFVAPMQLGECVGEGIVVKAGRQLVFLEARLWGTDGKLAVHATATAGAPAHWMFSSSEPSLPGPSASGAWVQAPSAARRTGSSGNHRPVLGFCGTLSRHGV